MNNVNDALFQPHDLGTLTLPNRHEQGTFVLSPPLPIEAGQFLGILACDGSVIEIGYKGPGLVFYCSPCTGFGQASYDQFVGGSHEFTYSQSSSTLCMSAELQEMSFLAAAPAEVQWTKEGRGSATDKPGPALIATAGVSAMPSRSTRPAPSKRLDLLRAFHFSSICVCRL